MKKNILLIIIFAFLIISGTFFLRADINHSIQNWLFSRANYYFNGGIYNLNAAQKYYKAAIFINPNIPNAHYQLARIAFVKNNLDEALSEINTEISLNPANKRSYYIKGLINTYRLDYETAISDFQKFIEWSSPEWAAYNDLARVYYEKGDYAEAKNTASKGLNIFPDNAWLLNGLGLAELKLKEYSLAKDSLAKAAEKADEIKIIDWQKAYPGNNPAFSEKELKQFKYNIRYNLELADYNINSGGIFVSACSASTYYSCSGNVCSGFSCDPDHQSCSSSCDSNLDCCIHSLTSSGPTSLRVGDSRSYTAYYDPDGALCPAGLQNITSLAGWTSSNPSILSIVGSGVALGQLSGWADVISTYAGLSSAVSVRVLAIPTLSFSINPISVFSGQAATFSWFANGYNLLTTCTASANPPNAEWSGNIPLSGPRDVHLFYVSRTQQVFTIFCSNADGSVTGSQSVTVKPLIIWKEIPPL